MCRGMPGCPWDTCGGGPGRGLVGFLWGSPEITNRLLGVVHDAVVGAAGAGGAGAGAVAAEHLRGGPPVEFHQVALGAAAVEPGVAEVVPEPVREGADAALAPAAPASKTDKKPADSAKDPKSKPGKESAKDSGVTRSRRPANADLDGAPIPPAPVGSR